MDLSKAFDCLPNDLILEKLEFYGLSAKSISLLHSYLSSRYQRVKLGNTFSSWIGVCRGTSRQHSRTIVVQHLYERFSVYD